MGTLVNRSTFLSRMHPANALLYFIVAAFATNILALIMILGLPAFPRPLPSLDTTPKASSLSLSLDSAERANSEIQDSSPSIQDSSPPIQDSSPPIQDSSPPMQVKNNSIRDGLTARNSGSGTNQDGPALSPGEKFSLATIVLTFIALSVFVMYACIQKWKQCYPVPIAWWDVYETVLWIVFVFELGISSLALGRWLMLLCDLWGEAGRKLWLIREYFLFMAVAIAIFVPFVLLSRCFQGFREWYRTRPKAKKDEVATPLEVRGLLTTDN